MTRDGYEINPVENNLPARSPGYNVTRHMSSVPMMPRNMLPQGTYGTEIISTPESPEAILARTLPRKAAKLLDKIHTERNYAVGMSLGTNIVNNLVDRMSEEEREKLSQIEISPNEEKSSGFLGLRKTKSLVIKLRR